MNLSELHVSAADVHKLLSAANGDGALLYLYLQCGNPPEGAAEALQLNENRVNCALAVLRQLCLWEPRKQVTMMGERPRYSETDVVRAMDGDVDFRCVQGELQRVLGRPLNTEELKIILGFTNYLGLPKEVISILVNYCRRRAQLRGSNRNPSLRTIEKEAYAWAEMGIDTLEEAAAYVNRQERRASELGQLMEILQIRGRNLTPGEEKYAKQWLDWGFDKKVIAMAYERTCLNTGGLSWAYMNKILNRWQQEGLLTVEKVANGDKKPVPKGASGQLGEAELEAIRRALQEV